MSLTVKIAIILGIVVSLGGGYAFWHYKVKESGKTEVKLEQERKLNTTESYVEVRLDGPHFRQNTAESWTIKCSVNLLVHHCTTRDFYALGKMIGTCVTALPNVMPIFQYNDDNAAFGCMNLTTEYKIHRFGAPREREKVSEATVEVSYKLEL